MSDKRICRRVRAGQYLPPLPMSKRALYNLWKEGFGGDYTFEEYVQVLLDDDNIILEENKMGEDLIGKTITEIDINGYGVYLKVDDGTILDFNASDGGYSSYTISRGDDNE